MPRFIDDALDKARKLDFDNKDRFIAELEKARELYKENKDYHDHLKNAIDLVKGSEVKELKTIIDILMNHIGGYAPADYGYSNESYPRLRESINLGVPVLLKEAIDGSDGLVWNAVLIKAGLSANNFMYPPEVLRAAIPLFEGVKCYADHPQCSCNERSIRDLVGWFSDVRWDDNTKEVKAKFHILESQTWFSNMVREVVERGRPELVNLSILGDAFVETEQKNGKRVNVVKKIERINSVDAVAEGAAGGRLVASKRGGKMEDQTELQEVDVLKKQVETLLAEQKKIESETLAIRESLMREACSSKLSAALAESGLPESVKKRIRDRFEGKIFDDGQLREAIDDARTILLEAGQFKPGVTIQVGKNENDKYRDAMLGLFTGKPENGVPPFRSLKEAYSHIKGKPYLDIDPREMLRESLGYASWNIRESVTTATWSEILGDSINRRMLREYADIGYDDWKLIVSTITPVNDFRTMRRMRLGGYGTLSVVNQGGAYQPLTSPTDEEATYVVSKRGNLEDLTMETIVNDDVGAVKRIPIKLARAAKITLYRFVFDFLANGDTTPTTYDNVALFSTSHGNRGNAALSDTSLTDARIAMRDQTAYGSNVDFPLFTPKYLVVPNELHPLAWRLVNSDFRVLGAESSPVYQVTEPNFHKNFAEIIVVPYWTDPNNWYLVADPKFVDTIEIGFWQGKEEPELFVQEDQNVGSVFTADKITFKIRHIYGGAVLDHRGFYGSIVT